MRWVMSQVLVTLALRANPALRSHLTRVCPSFSTESGDLQMAGFIRNMIPILTSNLLSSIKKSNSLKHYKSSNPMMVVTFGPEGGAGQLFFGITVGPKISAMVKSRTMMVGMFQGRYAK